MKKILVLSLIFLLMLSLFSITGHAKELAMADAAGDVPSDAPTPSAEDVPASPFEDFLQSAGSTLLSLGALFGSLLITFLYKSGTLSSMRTGMSSLEALLGKSQAITEECSLLVHDLEARMAALESSLSQSEAESPLTAAKNEEKTDFHPNTQSKEV